jgi:eukaryotic-like serine/threonine-protein kinase
VQIALESDDVAEAERLATAFSSRADAWSSAEQGAGVDKAVWLLRAGAKNGTDFESERQARVSALLRSGVHPGLAWTYAYAAVAETKDEALAALSVLGQFAPLTSFLGPVRGIPDAEIGHAYWLAGDADRAIVHLERAVRHCRVVSWPYELARAGLELGRAREARGETALACAAYARVLRRWGDARPRSVTADAARARANALGCSQ